MTTNRITLALAVATVALLGACAPVTSYSEAEAPKNLALDTSTVRFDVAFPAGSAYVGPSQAAKLHRLATTGSIGAADRITVVASGSPALAQQRIASVAAVLLHDGIVVSGGSAASVPPNRAMIEVNRTLVTLPACPNWSQTSHGNYDNQPSSNFGCATETNLGLMVAYPSDLASGRPTGVAAGEPAAAAMRRYLTDKVELPATTTANPFSAAASATPAATPTTGSQ